MIRRDDDGGFLSPSMTTRLAGNLERWGGKRSPPQPRGEVLFAVREHDCGWKEWDSSPKINPENGYPANFMEMESSDQNGIWRSSFESHAQEHPYASALVALHFARFNRKLLTKDPSDVNAKSLEGAIDGFVFDKLGIETFETGRRPPGSKNKPQAAPGRGYNFPRPLPRLGIHGDRRCPSIMRAIPEARLKSDDGFNFTVSPYPFSGTDLKLRVQARKLARKLFRRRGFEKISRRRPTPPLISQ
jgi:hypothetical protein